MKSSLLSTAFAVFLTGMALPAGAAVTGMDKGILDVSGEVFEPTCALTITDGTNTATYKNGAPTTATDPVELAVKLTPIATHTIGVGYYIASKITLTFKDCSLGSGTSAKLYFPTADNPDLKPGALNGGWQDPNAYSSSSPPTPTPGISNIFLDLQKPNNDIINAASTETLAHAISIDSAYLSNTAGKYTLNYPMTLIYNTRELGGKALTPGSFHTKIAFVIAYE